MHKTLEWRARGLVSRIAPFIEPQDQVLDIGWGTGHNGQRLQEVSHARVSGLDVVDMSVTGPKPILYDGTHIPFPDHSFDVTLLIYTLHYITQPVLFLQEVKRVTKKRILIIQTTCEGAVGRGLHRTNEWIFGKAAFHTARACGLVAHVPCSLLSKHDFGHQDLLGCARQAGLALECARLEPYAGFLPLGRFTCCFSRNGDG